MRKFKIIAPFALIFVVGVGLSIWIQKWSNEEALYLKQHRIDIVIENNTLAIQQKIIESFSTVEILQFIFTKNEDISSSEFRIFTEPLFAGNSGIKALSWVPFIADSEKLKYEQEQRIKTGNSDFKITQLAENDILIEAQKCKFYFPVTYIEPALENTEAFGFDIYSNINRKVAIDKAIETNSINITSPIKLVQDTSGYSFLTILPVKYPNHKINSENQKTIKGLISAVFKIDHLINDALKNNKTLMVDLVITDITISENIVIYGNDKIIDKNSILEKKTINVLDRKWELKFIIKPEVLKVKKTSTFLIIGLLIMLLFLILLVLPVLKYNSLKSINTKLQAEKVARIASQEILRESEERFRRVFEEGPLGMAMANFTDGKFKDVNQALCTMLGYTADEMKKLTFIDITHPECVDDDKYVVSQFIEGKIDIHRTIKKYIKKNGDTIWATRDLTRVMESDGKSMYALAMIRDITTQKQAEDELIQSQNKLKTAIESMTDAVFISDLEGNFIDFNDAFAIFHKFKSKEECSKTFNEYPKIIEVCFENGEITPIEMWAVPRALRGETATNVVYSLRRIDSGEKWIGSYSFSPIRNSIGEVIGSVVVARDITDIKNAEIELGKEKAILKAIVDNIPVMLTRFNPDTNILYLNKEFEEILGWKTEDLANIDLLEQVYPDEEYRKYAQEFMQKASEEWKEFQVKAKNGKIIDSEWCNIKLENGSQIGIGIDITEKKKSANEIIISNNELKTLNRIIQTSTSTIELEQLLNTILDEALGIVGLEGGTVCMINSDNTLKLVCQRETSDEIIKDLDENNIKIGECLCGNCAKELCPLILRTREQVLQFSTREVLIGEKINFHAAFPFVSKNKCLGVICLFTRNNKIPTQRSLDLVETLVKEISVAIENSLLIRDLEIRVEERTEKLNAVVKELQTFTYSVSHDLKAPLRGIDGFSKILVDVYSKDLNDEAKSFINIIRKSTQNMNQLIDDLLDYTRLERSIKRKDKIHIKEFISTILTLYRAEIEEYNFNINVDVYENTIISDSNCLNIALRNLIENSIKFTKHIQNPKIDIYLTEQKDTWLFEIKDNGLGFDMKYHDRIFDIFQRLHRAEDYPGTGIGLAMVRKAISRINGKLWAISTLNEGSSFFIEIPKLTDPKQT